MQAKIPRGRQKEKGFYIAISSPSIILSKPPGKVKIRHGLIFRVGSAYGQNGYPHFRNRQTG